LTGGKGADKISVKMLRLLTFGGLGLDSGDEAVVLRVRPQRLALLAAVAGSGESGITRERLSSFFWPDSDEERARHSLRQTLYELRHEIGRDVLRSGTAISLDPGVITADVSEFRTALASGDLARAVSYVRGPFLEGFYLPGATLFERWVEEERARLQAATTQALTGLATQARVIGDHEAAIEWRRQLTVLDPLSGRFALGFLKALAAGGHRAEALVFARSHEAVVRRELEADPDPDIRALEAALRAMPGTPAGDPSTLPLPAHVPAPLDAPAAQGVAAGARAEQSMPSTPPAAPPDGRPDPASGASAVPANRRRTRRYVGLAVAVVALALAGARFTLFASRTPDGRTTFAIGLIREEGMPDSLRIGGVITDMLATNLARVEGLPVLANWRLFDVMRPGQDTLADGYADAARRAGATELVEGRLLSGPAWGLALELRRVDLGSGVVKGAYRVTAPDRYALVDSATAAIARDLDLGMPGGSVADATTPSPVAYRLYEEGLRSYYQYDQLAAFRLMEAALSEDTTFAMAAYYASLTAPGARMDDFRRQALRLARRAPERERLTITADILGRTLNPVAAVVAESLSLQYPDDPRAHEMLARAKVFAGDWPAAVSAFERAIAIDSAAEPSEKQYCRLCEDLSALADVYFWWDSIDAAARTARRHLRLRSDKQFISWALLLYAAARAGRDSAASAAYVRLAATNPAPLGSDVELRMHILLENYDEVERGATRLLASPRASDVGTARWLLAIALRNQGRLSEAERLTRTGRLGGFPAPAAPEPAEDIMNGAAVALERGDTRSAAALFNRWRDGPVESWFPGIRARHMTWTNTLLGTALAAAGDTVPVKRLADTVASWGQLSGFGRDRKAHHFLRGLVHAAGGRDDEAITQFRAAVHSWSLGLTRINAELAKALLRRGHPAEAVAVLQPALRGEVDAANLWITRTELHELLAQAHDAAGQPDSAALHYRAVVRAWERADARFTARRDSALAWLQRAHASPQDPAAPQLRRPQTAMWPG
jgi:DNA-binding SARP family transcriptional activator